MMFEYERGEAEAYAKFLLNEYFTVLQIRGQKIGLQDIKTYVSSLATCVKIWYYDLNPEESPYAAELKRWLERMTSQIQFILSSNYGRIGD